MIENFNMEELVGGGKEEINGIRARGGSHYTENTDKITVIDDTE